MNCRTVRHRLLQCRDVAYGAAVRRHLRACSLCRNYAEAIAQIARPGTMPLWDPGEPLVQQTLARIRDVAPRASGRHQAVRGRLHPIMAPAARAAWAAVFLVAAAALWQIRQPEDSETAPSAAILPEGRIGALEEQLRMEAAWIDAWDQTAALDETDRHAAWPEINDDELDRLAEIFDEIAG